MYNIKEKNDICLGSTKFRTNEKGHELKAHDSFF